jgi:hypothetical protein
MRNVAKLFTVFVVSWATGTQYALQPCTSKEPDGVICAKSVEQRTEKTFKSAEAADAFKAVMEQMKAANVKLEKRAK